MLALAAASMASCGMNKNEPDTADNPAAQETSTSKKIIAHMKEDPMKEQSAVSSVAFPENTVSIDKCTVTVKGRIYAEKLTRPFISVKYGEKTLVEDKDYKITYDDNTDNGAGKYSLTLSMCGEYHGSKKYDYYIKPVGTSLVQTGSKVGSVTVGWKTRNSADGYEIEYGKKKDLSDSQTKEISGTDTDNFCFDRLEDNTTLFMRIRSFKNLDDGEKLYSSYSDVFTASTAKIEQRDGVTYIDGIIIANKTYSLPEDFGDGLDSEATEAFYSMSNDAVQEGIWLEIVSGFRSYYT